MSKRSHDNASFLSPALGCMQQPECGLTQTHVDLLRAEVSAHGVSATARKFGVGREVLIRAAGGLPLRKASAFMLRAALEAMEHAAAE